MSSYDPLKEPTNGPPTYIAQYPSGYQMNEYTPTPGTATTHIPPENAPVPRAGRQEQEEREQKSAEDEDYVPASIPVAHLNLDFKECFHEHKSTKTFPALYNAMGFVYKYTKLITYHVFVILFGMVFAILFAFINGLISFIHVWIYGPALKITLLWVYAFTPLITVPLRAIFTPIVDVSARIFRQIRIQANLTGPFAENVAGQRRNV